MILVSFDVDGTLETGDPPGPLSMDLVRRAKRLGYRVGSSSDRTLNEQRTLWRTHDIEVDFVSHKHMLHEIRDQFQCDRNLHIGDTDLDRHYAVLAGFEFWWVTEIPADGAPGWVF
jgi:hypothetical protein